MHNESRNLPAARRAKYLLSIWTMWIVVTVIYLPTALIAALPDSEAVRQAHVMSYVATTLGLFVPFGLVTGLGPLLSVFISPTEIHPFRLLAFPVAFVVMWYAEKLADKRQYRGMQRVTYHLFVLLCVTFIVDVLLTSSWVSMSFFLMHDIRGGSW